MRPPLVLAYHGLARFARQLDPRNLMVDPTRFRWQILGLRRRGYRFVRLSEFVAFMEEGRPPIACVLSPSTMARWTTSGWLRRCWPSWTFLRHSSSAQGCWGSLISASRGRLESGS
jgi:hypothetical protein